jgi:putative oxidoreductase
VFPFREHQKALEAADATRRIGIKRAIKRVLLESFQREAPHDMAHFMHRFESYAYALFRIVAGFLLLWHGSQKLFGFPKSAHEAPAFILYVAGPIELFGGLLIMLGLLTGWAGFICSGLMAFAYWMAHGTKAFLPIQNGGELAALYCFAFLFISARGAGIWSVESARR